MIRSAALPRSARRRCGAGCVAPNRTRLRIIRKLNQGKSLPPGSVDAGEEEERGGSRYGERRQLICGHQCRSAANQDDAGQDRHQVMDDPIQLALNGPEMEASSHTDCLDAINQATNPNHDKINPTWQIGLPRHQHPMLCSRTLAKLYKAGVSDAWAMSSLRAVGKPEPSVTTTKSKPTRVPPAPPGCDEEVAPSPQTLDQASRIEA